MRESAVRRAHLLAALREIAAARERSEGGGAAATASFDRLRDDITETLELLENRRNGAMSTLPLRAQRRTCVAPESDQR